MSKPLEGVKVIELATFIAAATAGRFMADLGADVIKIESAKGDPLRYTAPSEGRPLDMYENTTWDLENGNKRCISLNMKTPEGKEAFFKLLDSADVLITNWRVQALQRAGLDYETLKERYPKLVYAICTGYGEYGPDKDLPGFDFTAFFARGGYFETLRQRSDVPFNHPTMKVLHSSIRSTSAMVLTRSTPHGIPQMTVIFRPVCRIITPITRSSLQL